MQKTSSERQLPGLPRRLQCFVWAAVAAGVTMVPLLKILDSDTDVRFSDQEIESVKNTTRNDALRLQVSGAPLHSGSLLVQSAQAIPASHPVAAQQPQSNPVLEQPSRPQNQREQVKDDKTRDHDQIVSEARSSVPRVDEVIAALSRYMNGRIAPGKAQEVMEVIQATLQLLRRPEAWIGQEEKRDHLVRSLGFFVGSLNFPEQEEGDQAAQLISGREQAVISREQYLQVAPEVEQLNQAALRNTANRNVDQFLRDVEGQPDVLAAALNYRNIDLLGYNLQTLQQAQDPTFAPRKRRVLYLLRRALLALEALPTNQGVNPWIPKVNELLTQIEALQ